MILVLMNLIGCANAIPEMTEEEHTLVVNYAADMIQKYNKYQEYKLEEIQSEEETTESEIEENEIPEEAISVEEVTEESLPVETPAPEVTLNSLLMIQDFDFTYEGMELADVYPYDGTDLYFSMSATSGNQLLVLKFNAQNLSEEEQLLDISSLGVRFKIVVNGVSKNALTTLLLNDFSNVKENVEAGQNKELVLLCEIAQDENVDSVSLNIKNEDTKGTILLQ